MTSTPTGWASLRQQARQYESQTETLFSTYSQYASMTNIPSKPTEDEQKTESQLNTILQQREETLSSLSRLLDSDPAPSATKSAHLARHREVLSQHRSDFSRLRSQLSHARDRANLLSTVRSDISSYRANAADPAAAEANYMLDERARLDNSHGMADSVLSQAYAINESFGQQREQLENVRRRITGVVGSVPGINGLIGRIGSRKRRDGIVLGSLIGVCMFGLWYFV